MESWKLSRLIIIIWRYTWEQLVASCNCRLASCGDEREEEKKKRKKKEGKSTRGCTSAEAGKEEGRGAKRPEESERRGGLGAGGRDIYSAGSGRNWNRDERNDDGGGDTAGRGEWRGMKGFEVAIARNSRFARLRASAETAICIGNYTGWITPRNERSVLRVIGAHYKSRDERIARHLHSVWGSDGWYHVVTGRGGADGGRSFSKGGGKGGVDFCLRESFRDNLSSR